MAYLKVFNQRIFSRKSKSLLACFHTLSISNPLPKRVKKSETRNQPNNEKRKKKERKKGMERNAIPEVP